MWLRRYRRGSHRIARRRPTTLRLLGVAVVLVGGTIIALFVVPGGGSRLYFKEFDQALPPSAPVLPESKAYVAALVNDAKVSYHTVGVNLYPLAVVPKNLRKVQLQPSAGCNDFRPSTGTSVPIPDHVVLSGSSDNPLIIYQPSTNSDWELWQVAHSDGQWEACWGGKLNTADSSGTFTEPYGLSASGISYLATMVTDADVTSGHIDHAIALQMPTCSAPPIPPANRTDCPRADGQPPYGTRFRFPLSMQPPKGLSTFAKMVFIAVQRYGLVLTDQAGDVAIVAGRDADPHATSGAHSPLVSSWDGLPEYRVVASLPWNRLVAVGAPATTAKN